MRSVGIRNRPSEVGRAEVAADHTKAGGEGLGWSIVITMGKVVDEHAAGLRHGLEGTISVLKV